MARVAILRDTAGGVFPTGAGAEAYESFDWDTVVRNDYDFVEIVDSGGEPEIIQINTDRPILVHARLSYQETSTERSNWKADITINNSRDFFTTSSTGYCRDATHEFMTIDVWAFIHNPQPGDEMRVRWKYANTTTAPTGGSIAGESVCQIVEFDNIDNVGIFSANAGGAFDSGYSQVTAWNTILNTDSGVISPQAGGAFRVTENGNYLVIYGMSFDQTTDSDRTNRITKLVYNGDRSEAYTFIRGTENCRWGGCHGIDLIKYVSATEDLTVEASPGTAEVPNSNVSLIQSETQICIIQLNSDVEVARYQNGNGVSLEDVTGTTPTDIKVCASVSTFPTENTDSFQRSSDTQTELQKDGDYLLSAALPTDRITKTDTERFTGLGQITKNGTEQTDSGFRCYTRGQNGTTGTYNGGYNPAIIDSFQNGDLIGASVYEDPDVAATPTADDTIKGNNDAELIGINLDTSSKVVFVQASTEAKFSASAEVAVKISESGGNIDVDFVGNAVSNEIIEAAGQNAALVFTGGNADTGIGIAGNTTSFAFGATAEAIMRSSAEAEANLSVSVFAQPATTFSPSASASVKFAITPDVDLNAKHEESGDVASTTFAVDADLCGISEATGAETLQVTTAGISDQRTSVNGDEAGITFSLSSEDTTKFQKTGLPASIVFSQQSEIRGIRKETGNTNIVFSIDAGSGYTIPVNGSNATFEFSGFAQPMATDGAAASASYSFGITPLAGVGAKHQEKAIKAQFEFSVSTTHQGFVHAQAEQQFSFEEEPAGVNATQSENGEAAQMIYGTVVDGFARAQVQGGNVNVILTTGGSAETKALMDLNAEMMFSNNAGGLAFSRADIAGMINFTTNITFITKAGVKTKSKIVE